MNSITESSMTFSYEEGQCFYIEKSETYQKMQGVKMAEFLLIKSPNILIIEAKSSSPNPNNDQVKFDDFIQEIYEKLLNAFSLSVAMRLNRHAQTLPVNFQNIDLTNFRLCLIIKNHKEEWLIPLQDALKKSLYSTVKTWALSPNAVIVINDKIAKEQGLIQ